MDFTSVLQYAKQNRERSKDEDKYYKTKLAPPKKESRESRQLSDNIKKFLQKREQEEKQKEAEHKKKVASLLAMRDEKSKNKIRKMLKVTKSANKSVLDDVNTSQTADIQQGIEQPDEDDYGYVSQASNAFYQKYMEKVKDVKDEKGFTPSRPQSLRDLSGTKERVKAALTSESKPIGQPRQRKSHSTAITSSSSSSSKTLYDPESERRDAEKQGRKLSPMRKAPPKPMDFRELLKLAERKQQEPQRTSHEVKKIRKEPERLLTAKEKRELEEIKLAKEARARRELELKATGGRSNSSAIVSKPNNERVVAQGKMPSFASKSNLNKGSHESSHKAVPESVKKVSNSLSLSSSSSQKPKSISSARPSSSDAKQSVSISSKSSTSSSISEQRKSMPSKASYNGPTREFPPKNTSNKNTREFPPRDIRPTGTPKARQSEVVQKTRQFPPTDVRYPPATSKYKPMAPKRRIDDYDDEEYDSEMDDFIDDGDAEADYSSAIRDIFGYDKSKYRDLDDDDAAMESNFAQVQREEYLSKKIGIQEDLEDMRLEAIEKEKKRKTLKKLKM